MISHLLNRFLVGILFVDLLERRFPDKFRAILTDITYNAFYFYSNVQIYVYKATKQINEYIETTPTLSKIKKELTAIIKTDKRMIISQESTDYDFTVFSWLGDDNKCVHKTIRYDIYDPRTILPECSLERINIKLT
jgi:hypothetical protein